MLSDFQGRRQKIFNNMPENSIAIVQSANVQHRNNDTEFPFRQDSYFYYLTGFDESSAMAVLIKNQSKTQFLLFCLPKDPQAEQWTGGRAGVKGAKAQFGADEAYPITELTEKMLTLLAGLDHIYYLMGHHRSLDQNIITWLDHFRQKKRSNEIFPSQLLDLRNLFDESRLIKSPEEISQIKKACDISVNAHIQAMQQCKDGMNESELEGILLYQFLKQGARQVAYPCIVAGGNNACTLHYTKNDSALKKGDLVLIDAGAEYQYYASDITRTFPVGGEFTPAQKAIYELVLASQMAAIEQIKPELPFEDIQKIILKVLVKGLVDLNILKGDVDKLIQEKAYLPYYMHNSGHWLGLDVHDVGNYGSLKAGMVLTVEPGLYLSSQNTSLPEAYRGIGIRIEDDVLVTENGCEVLTQALPKTVNEIEQLCRGMHV